MITRSAVAVRTTSPAETDTESIRSTPSRLVHDDTGRPSIASKTDGVLHASRETSLNGRPPSIPSTASSLSLASKHSQPAHSTSLRSLLSRIGKSLHHHHHHHHHYHHHFHHPGSETHSSHAALPAPLTDDDGKDELTTVQKWNLLNRATTTSHEPSPCTCSSSFLDTEDEGYGKSRRHSAVRQLRQRHSLTCISRRIRPESDVSPATAAEQIGEDAVPGARTDAGGRQSHRTPSKPTPVHHGRDDNQASSSSHLPDRSRGRGFFNFHMGSSSAALGPKVSSASTTSLTLSSTTGRGSDGGRRSHHDAEGHGHKDEDEERSRRRGSLFARASQSRHGTKKEGQHEGKRNSRQEGSGNRHGGEEHHRHQHRGSYLSRASHFLHLDNLHILHFHKDQSSQGHGHGHGHGHGQDHVQGRSHQDRAQHTPEANVGAGGEGGWMHHHAKVERRKSFHDVHHQRRLAHSHRRELPDGLVSRARAHGSGRRHGDGHGLDEQHEERGSTVSLVASGKGKGNGQEKGKGKGRERHGSREGAVQRSSTPVRAMSRGT
ncbi:hypothetical protein OC835_001050 [Tilletia horrida]|nr:hypothetical protein OC835_001050 [Tilletia horrida]